MLVRSERKMASIVIAEISKTGALRELYSTGYQLHVVNPEYDTVTTVNMKLLDTPRR